MYFKWYKCKAKIANALLIFSPLWAVGNYVTVLQLPPKHFLSGKKKGGLLGPPFSQLGF